MSDVSFTHDGPRAVPDRSSRHLPLAVYVLGFGIFAQGTSELMLAGLLPQMADDLHVSVPRTGLLITGFALGMLLGAPVLGILTLRMPRRRALLSFVAVFIGAHIVGAVTASYGLLFVSRFVGAFAYAGFWAVAAGTAVGMVAEDRSGRAMGVVAGGLTVATVIGLPAGSMIGQWVGWRGAFWAVAVLSAVAFVALVPTIPRSAERRQARVVTEFRAIGNRRLWLSYAMTATSMAALMITFAYLGAMLEQTTHLGAAMVPIFLLLYGIGAVVGITIGGRVADGHPVSILVAGFTGVAVISALLAVSLHSPVATAVFVFGLGAMGFATNPALNSRVFGIAPAAPVLAPALNVSSFNAGISVGPWIGGAALDAGAAYPVLPVIGVVLAVTALGVVAVDGLVRRRSRSARAKESTAVTTDRRGVNYPIECAVR